MLEETSSDSLEPLQICHKFVPYSEQQHDDLPHSGTVGDESSGHTISSSQQTSERKTKKRRTNKLKEPMTSLTKQQQKSIEKLTQQKDNQIQQPFAAKPVQPFAVPLKLSSSLHQHTQQQTNKLQLRTDKARPILLPTKLSKEEPNVWIDKMYTNNDKKYEFGKYIYRNKEIEKNSEKVQYIGCNLCQLYVS
uniref:Uncharacterized protein n=1 Tax=Meloidogyne hapla TaxID=6305 RepID=A0A1I8B623_MELHA